MNWPNWMEDHVWQWLTGISIGVVSIIVTIVLALRSKHSSKVSSIKGDGNVQVVDSPGATVSINEINSEKLARELAKHLPHQQSLVEKETEIEELKATIERLQKDSTNELKQNALHALSEDDTTKATALMEKSAKSREKQAGQLTNLAAQDWIDIGNIAFLKDSQRALSAYKKAMELDPLNPDACNLSGHVLYRLGNLDEAEQAYEHVLELAGEDKSCQAVAHGNLGIIYKTRGKLDKAEEFYMKSLEINKALGRKEGIASAYGNLGIIYQARGELDKAEEFYMKSLEIEKALGRKEGIALAYGNLGIIYQARGKLDKAEEFLMKSLEINKALGRKEGIASAYGNLGIIYQTRGELDKAEEFHMKSLEIEKALGRKEGIASDYSNLGNIYQTRGKLDKAEEFHMKSLEINKTLGQQEGMALVYASLGNIYQTRGDIDKACDYWKKSADLFTYIGAKDKVRMVSKLIADNCGKEK